MRSTGDGPFGIISKITGAWSSIVRAPAQIPRIPPLQDMSLTFDVSVGWVYIYANQQNISVSGQGYLEIDASKQSARASASSGAAGPPQEVFLDGAANGTRNFINVLSQTADPSKATPHNHSYGPAAAITDPADQAFCNWINPRPCSWQTVLAYWDAFEYVGRVSVEGQELQNFGQEYTYGADEWQVNRSVELAFFPNGSIARLNHTEYRLWGITHSIDMANHVARDVPSL